MASITSIHLPRLRSAVLQRMCACFFRGRKFLKLFKSLTVSQAVPEIHVPLSVGSKLEQSFCLCQMSVYSPVHSRICSRMHNTVYIHVHVHFILAIYIVHDRGAEGFAL